MSKDKINTKAKAKTTFRYDLLGTIPSETDKEFKTSKLPSGKQVLLSFLAELEDHTKRYAANATALKIKEIFDKARIPVLKHCKISQEVMKLHKKLLDVGKISKDRRDKPKEKSQID